MNILYSARVPSTEDPQKGRIESLERWIGELLLKNEELRGLLASTVVQLVDRHIQGEE